MIANSNFSKKLNEELENMDRAINIAVLGEPKCGKTSLIECYTEKQYDEVYLETVVNVYRTQMRINNYDFFLNIQ